MPEDQKNRLLSRNRIAQNSQQGVQNYGNNRFEYTDVYEPEKRLKKEDDYDETEVLNSPDERED